jgi:hypothetical protein
VSETVRGALLWSRAGLVALVACFVGAAGHVMADGLLPGPAVLLGLYAATTVLAAASLSRPASALRLTVLIGGGQALVHLVLSGSAGHHGAAQPTQAPGGARDLVVPVVDGRRVGSLLDAYQSGVGSARLTSGGGVDPVAELVAHTPMMAAHLAAAAVVALWLAHGERCLWTVLLLAAGAIRLLLSRPAPAPAPARVRTTPVHRDPVAIRLLARSVVRRGPPALLAG